MAKTCREHCTKNSIPEQSTTKSNIFKNLLTTSNFGQFFQPLSIVAHHTNHVPASGDEKGNNRRCLAVKERNFEKLLSLNEKRYISLYSTLREFLKSVFMITEFCQVRGNSYIFTFQKSGIWEYQ